MQTDIHIEVVSRYIIATVTQEGLSIFMITVSNEGKPNASNISVTLEYLVYPKNFFIHLL